MSETIENLNKLSLSDVEAAVKVRIKYFDIQWDGLTFSHKLFIIKLAFFDKISKGMF